MEKKVPGGKLEKKLSQFPVSPPPKALHFLMKTFGVPLLGGAAWASLARIPPDSFSPLVFISVSGLAFDVSLSSSQGGSLIKVFAEKLGAEGWRQEMVQRMPWGNDLRG